MLLHGAIDSAQRRSRRRGSRHAALDHDANISPWLAAAEDAESSVHWVDCSPEDCTLDLENLEGILSPKTRVVAFTLASNALGSITGTRAEVVRIARADRRVHCRRRGSHRTTSAARVEALGVDLLFCSPYKFFGPHLGMMFGRKELLDELEPYKVRPPRTHRRTAGKRAP